MPLVHAQEAANLDCIHCGLCLAVCPTYLQMGNEVDSPRGRILLMNALNEGRIAPSSTVFGHHIEMCLECRACETACPSGVRFSLMMNEARETVRTNEKVGFGTRLIRKLVFEVLFPSRRAMHCGFRLLRLYQRSGLQRIVRFSGILNLFPSRLKAMEALLPEVPPSAACRLPEMPGGKGRVSVAFFQGCIMPELFASAHEATLRVLVRNDVSVCSPAAQTCCGALHAHSGEMEQARAMARRNIDAFDVAGVEFVVVNAAGCGAMLKEYGELLEDDAQYSARAAAFSGRVRDISEFLDEIGVRGELGSLPMKVTYDDPCHLLHAQKIKDAPRNLLRRIPGLELVEMRDSDRCCGSAGIYNITHPEMAGRLLAEKAENVAKTGADTIATGNPGCLLQIRQGLRERGLATPVVHPIELLDRAYEAASKKGKNA
jgi:glycolate oxidase iron-sulfur subunit